MRIIAPWLYYINRHEKQTSKGTNTKEEPWETYTDMCA